MCYTRFFNFRLLLCLAALFFVTSIQAQQNQKTVFSNPQGFSYAEAHQILSTADGGSLLTGLVADANQLNNLPRLIKLDNNGLTEWDHTYTDFAPPLPHGTRLTPVNTVPSPDGGWLVSVQDDSTDINLMHVNAAGDLLWTKSLFGIHAAIRLLGTNNNNHYLAYQSVITGPTNTDFPFYELDQDGNILNTFLLPKMPDPFPIANTPYGTYACLTTDGAIQILYYKVVNGNYKSFFARYDDSGNLLWESQQLPFNSGTMAPTANGGFLFLDNDLQLHRYDAQGVLLSEFNLDPAFGVKTVYSIQESADGGIVLAGQTVTQRGVMAKLAADYSTVWVAEAPLDAQPSLRWLRGVATPDGWAAGVGSTTSDQIGFVRFFENSGVTIKTISGKIARDVNNSCTVETGESGLNGASVIASNNTDYFYTAFSAADGTYQLQLPPGDFTVTANPAQQFFFVCPGGNDIPVSLTAGGNNAVVDFPVQSLDVIHQITGAVKLDNNSNCAVDQGDTPLTSWKVEASGNGFSLTDYTDVNGNYSMYMPNGTYTVNVTPINPNFGICGTGTQTATFNATQGETAVADFAVYTAFECGIMRASVQGSAIRPCTTATFTIAYRNTGTIAANDVKITVTLDPALTYVSSSIPPVSVNGNVLVFDRGTVEPGYGSQSFNIYATPDCSLAIGQEVCVTAAIEPDKLCYSAAQWSGAIVNITGACGPGPNEVSFTIANIGSAANAAPLEYVIIEEQVVLKSGTFQLPAGGSVIHTVPVTGNTQVGMAQQEPGFPGDTSVTYTLTNCLGLGSNPAGFSGNAGPFISQSCFSVINSLDPNEKYAQPLGYGPEHIVWPGTKLTYSIHFQNTGNDTAYLVVVRDTLSPDLDPGTIELLGGSHPYRFELLAGRIMQFTFDNIKLVDSLTNAVGSQGFVEFAIKHRKDLPLGTNIGNSAAIYFDFNKPVITNTVWRKIDKYFTVTAVNTPGESWVPVQIFPNPVTFMASFELPREYDQTDLSIELIDVAGRVIRKETFAGPRYILECGDLSAGVYFWRISEQGKVLTNGKIVKREEK